jgi:hypothetical protein
MNWTDLVRIERELGRLEEDILKHAAAHQTGPYCANLHWYGYGGQGEGFKKRMWHLVGRYAAASELRTS